MALVVAHHDSSSRRRRAGWNSRMSAAAQALSLLVGRELRLSFRRPDQLLQPLVFFLIVTTLFPLGLNAQLSLLKDMAPGVLWAAALLSSLLSLDSLFKGDADDGTLEQLALSGQGLTVIVIGKTPAHWLVSGAALVLVSPLVAIALGIPGAAFGTMLLSLTLGTLTLSWLGAHRRGAHGGSASRQRPFIADRAAAGDAAADIRRRRDGPGHFGIDPAGALYFLGLAMRVHVYPCSLCGVGRAAHHARMTLKGTDPCGRGSIAWLRLRTCIGLAVDLTPWFLAAAAAIHRLRTRRRPGVRTARLPARRCLPHHLCARAERVDLHVRLFHDGGRGRHRTDLAHQDGPCGGGGERAHRRVLHAAGVVHRLAVGPSDVGHLLGLGPAAHLRAHPAVPLRGRDVAARRPSRTRPTAIGRRRFCPSWAW